MYKRQREAIEARNADAKAAAESAGASLDGISLIMIRQSGDTGQLYGSVSARDIAELATESGHKVSKSQIRLDAPIKALGVYDLGVQLHAEVNVAISINVARSQDEAERQAAGENIIDALAAEQKELADEQASELKEAAAEMADQMAPDEDA